MTDTIWFELADCIGHALAKRWLARRTSSRNRPASDPVLAEQSLPEDQGVDGQPAVRRQQEESTQDE